MSSNPMEMLSGLLSDPNAMREAVDMLGSLGASSTEKKTDNAPHFPNQENEIKTEVPDISFLANLLSNNRMSMQAIGKMKKAYDTFNKAHDPSINLINALSPYLSSRRAMNANRLITAVKVSKAINVFKEE